MRELFQTADLFSGLLPPFPDTVRTVARWHFADVAHIPMQQSQPRGAWSSSAWSTYDPDFYGTPDMASAIRLAREGWIDGAEAAARVHETLKPVIPQRRKLTRYQPAGMVPNVARCVAGNPAHMRIVRTEETSQRPVITLVCGIGAWANVESEAMIAHATAAAGVVDYLESSGYQTEVIALSRAEADAKCIEVATRVKGPGESLNLSVLAFCLGHPAMLRRHVFALRSMTPDMGSSFSSMGRSVSIPTMPDSDTFRIVNPCDYSSDMGVIERFNSMVASLRSQGCPGMPETD